jgi:hypothetical protein
MFKIAFKENIIRPSKYQCVICLERSKNPIKCNRCQKLICYGHVNKLNHKCPHCRL